jgi:hypothetical protein
MMTIIRAVLGAALLLTGRKLYWLFVGVIGFVLGFSLASMAFQSESEWVVLAIALTVGVLAAVLAGFVQRLAVGLAGFLAGGMILTTLFNLLDFNQAMPVWLLFIIGGILGVILVAVLFDWALILLSSLAGADLIVNALEVKEWLGVLLFLALFVIGVSVQAATLRKKST